MRLSLAAAAIALASCAPLAALAADEAHLLLYPSSPNTLPGAEVTGRDVNRILSHHLKVPGDRLGALLNEPKEAAKWTWIKDVTGDQDAQDTGDLDSMLGDKTNRLVIYVDGVKHGAEGWTASESELRQTHFMPSSPSSASWHALVSQFGDRLAAVRTQGLGLFGGLALSAGSTARDWFASSLAPQVYKKTLDLFDVSADDVLAHFHQELATAERAIVHLNATPKYQALRFQSLPALEKAYGRDSEAYRSALAAIRATVQSALANAKKAKSEVRLAVILSSSTNENSDKAQKRDVADLLAPFSTARQALTKRQYAPEQDFFHADEDRTSYAHGSELDMSKNKNKGSSNSSKPDPADFKRKCFKSKDELNKATKECSGHGDAFEKMQGGVKCYRCVCRPFKTENGVVYFAGDACEKVDVSSPFVLLASTSIVLLIVVAGSISILYSIGNNKLPGTLASVSVPTFKL